MIKVHIVFGPQGAGKTTYSKQLSKDINGVHLSIDDWMWKLYGDDLPKPMNLKWIMERVERCEKQIWATALQIVQSGGRVVLDLGFTKQKKRISFQNLAQAENMSLKTHFVQAPHSLRKKRVLNRNIEKGDSFSFEVTEGMFDFMEREFDYPTDRELENVIVVDTGANS